MWLAQGPQCSDAGEARTRYPSVSSQALYHWATALPLNWWAGFLNYIEILRWIDEHLRSIDESPFSSRGGFLIITENNLIKLTHYDETKKMAHDSQIVRAKKNSSWATAGPAKGKRQVPTDRLKLYARAVIESEAWPTDVQLNEEHPLFENWAATWVFQQCGILTSVDSEEPVQPPFSLRNSKWCSVSS